ncbi:MAG: hypothetical protein ACUBOA_09475 [Candidatus Loosdrechtia sp.]|uniref:hypothetical protein n=1 Tax=Candidatus Loosdrechtia sp. TaxID=3101272 RepID=UPI003A767388|nr:MAG: hypothetical protein QY305_12810 [Candidatus Jettenia sp. AMX2]
MVPVEAVAHVDKVEGVIGEQITLTVRVQYNGDYTIQFPEIGQRFGVFNIKNTGIITEPKKEKDGNVLVERKYLLRSYEIGQVTVPPVKIRYQGAQSEGEVATDEIPVTIRGVIQEGEAADDIRDIRPPVDVPISYKKLIQWIAGGLGLLAFAGMIYGFICKLKRGRKVPVRTVIKRPPHEIAYELLERLLREDLVGKGFIKEYYYRITNILRHYIEDRFGLSAPERTTEEFLEEMVHTDTLEDHHKVLIREFLTHCDMVKYAKYGPSRTEINGTYAAAKRFIDETTVVFQVSSPK